MWVEMAGRRRLYSLVEAVEDCGAEGGDVGVGRVREGQRTWGGVVVAALPHWSRAGGGVAGVASCGAGVSCGSGRARIECEGRGGGRVLSLERGREVA